MLSPEQLDDALAECANEPIAHLGNVQPHGALLVSNSSDRIIGTSTSVASMLAGDAQDLIGLGVSEVVDPGILSNLDPLLAQDGQSLAAITWENPELPSLPIAVSGYRTTNHKFIVFHPGAGTDRNNRTWLEEISSLASRAEAAQNVVSLCQIIASTILKISKLDRVKVYRFTPEFHGEVIAEAKAEDIESYLGMFFPESDIPKQARELYLEHTFRSIVDVLATPSPICVAPELNPCDINLGAAALRSVSPVHIEYLKNMGIRSSMSVTLRKGDALWGLTACHHREPCYLDVPTRNFCELIGRVASMQIGLVEASDDLRLRQYHQVQAIKHTAEIADGSGEFDGMLDHVYAPINACGVAMVRKGEIVTSGDTPSLETIRAALPSTTPARRLDRLMACKKDQHSMLEGNFAGLLFMPAVAASLQAIIWFRYEETVTVNWAGDPTDKPVVMVGNRPRLEPRNSFKLWKEKRLGTAPPWLPSEVDYAAAVTWAFSKVELLDRIELVADLAQERMLALQRANRDLERFTYALAHDLKTPARGVAVGLDLLMEQLPKEALNPDLDDVLMLMRERTDRLSYMLKSILAFAETGKVSAEAVPFDLEKVARSILDELGATERVTLKINSPSEELMFPPGTMDRSPQNLLENAIRHHEQNSIKIGLSGRVVEGQFDLSITDDGPGIPQHFHSRAFDVFSKGSGSGTEPKSGSGLGLGIVRRIIEGLGGSIAIRSEPDIRRGTTMQILVPYKTTRHE